MPGFVTPDYIKGDTSALMPGILDLWPYCGDDFEQMLQFRYQNEDETIGDPIDLTPFVTKLAEIRTIGTKDLITTFELFVPDGDIAGNIVLHLPWEETKKLEIYPELEWDMAFTFTSIWNADARVTVLKGKVYPMKEVTL